MVLTAMLFSCQNGLNEARKFETDKASPQTVGEGVNLFYTDSGNVSSEPTARTA